MDKDRASGKVKDIKGRIKRQAGEWTGDEKLQGEGRKDQAEGKVQNIAGRAQDAGRHAMQDVRRKADEQVERARQRHERRHMKGRKAA
jgi:uncharacterized protein YjbJ (UPF0337 family)